MSASARRHREEKPARWIEGPVGMERPRSESIRRPSRVSGALPGNAEIFSVRCARVVPATWRRDDLIGLGRTPGAVLIFVDRGVRFEDWIDDSPGLFDVILACKICGISGQRVA